EREQPGSETTSEYDALHQFLRSMFQRGVLGSPGIAPKPPRPRPEVLPVPVPPKPTSVNCITASVDPVSKRFRTPTSSIQQLQRERSQRTPSGSRKGGPMRSRPGTTVFVKS